MTNGEDIFKKNTRNVISMESISLFQWKNGNKQNI